MTMILDFYLSASSLNTKDSKQKISFSNSVSLYKFTRHYDGRKIVYYTTTSLFGREMYIYIGNFIEKLVQSYIEVCEKCTKRSVKKAFELCPNLTKWISQHVKGKSSPIKYLRLSDNHEEKVYCLGLPYSILFDGKKSTYKELAKIADTIREETLLINKSALVAKGELAAKTKRVLATTGKYALKAGAMILLGAIGANADFDFDFDIQIPDVDLPDFDLPDIDISNFDGDIDTDVNYDVPDQGNSISFLGNSKSDGFIPDGKVKLERTISGITDTFDLFTKGGHEYVKVNGCFIQIDGSGTVNINNIKYDKI